MFDIQTESYLRRSHAGRDSAGPTLFIPAALVASLILWTTVLLRIL